MHCILMPRKTTQVKKSKEPDNKVDIKADLDQASQSTSQKTEQPNPQVANLSYFSRLYNLIFHTKSFISKIEQENEYFPILLTFVITTAIATIIQFFISLTTLISSGPSVIFKQAVSAIGGIGFAFAIPFILCMIFHIGVLLLGGRRGFFNTFKPVTYSMVIGTAYSLLYTIIISFYNLISPISSETILVIQSKLQSGTISFADIAPLKIQLGIFLVIILLSIIHAIYAAVLGISKYQNMKKWKSFISLILIPLIIFVLLVIILVYIATVYKTL